MTEQSQRKLHIKWERSGIGFTRRQRASIRGLGLRRLHDVVEREDTPQIRGLVAAVPHLVTILDGPVKKSPWAALPEYTILPPVEKEKPAKRTPKASKVADAEVSEAGAEKKAAASKEADAKPAKTVKAAKASSSKEKAKSAKEPAKKKASKTAEKTAKPKTSKGKK